jgi:phosphohistidine phosphatase
MTAKLILTRHAKSDWGDPSLDDHDRPLNDRGRRSADAIGKWLASERHLPDMLISSTAMRTRETWALISRALPVGIAARWERRLYHAGPQDILDVLRRAQGQTILMLGHNPGIGTAAANLAAAPHPHPRFADYPTGATTVFRFDIDDWAEADWRGATIVDFIVPRELGVE